MPLTVTHAFVSAKADSADVTIVRPSNWNANHVVTGGLIDTFYISATGSDSNDGLSPATPWQTIAKVNSVTQLPGNTFLFEGGQTFTGTIVVNASGQHAFPITFDSYGTGRATINGGNNAAFTCANHSHIAIKDLIFIGSGLTTNTATAGLLFTGNTNQRGFTFTNLDISLFGFNALRFFCGDGTGATDPIYSDIEITDCNVHDCGQDGIGFTTLNQQTLVVPFYAAFANILIDGCTVYNITGQNTLGSATTGSGIVVQGCNGVTVQNCVVHDNALYCNLAGGGTGSSGPAIYMANVYSPVIQSNEVYNQTAVGHDGAGIMPDFGINNAIIQYNYIHDCQAAGFQTGTLTTAVGVHNNNVGTIFRYNIIANCGTHNGGAIFSPGVVIYTFDAAESITDFVFHNNTFVSNWFDKNAIPVFSDNFGFAGTMRGIVCNNMFLGGGDTTFVAYHPSGVTRQLVFSNNCYFGGSPTPINYGGGANISIAAWIANVGIEVIDYTSVIQQVDPQILGGPGVPYSVLNFATGAVPIPSSVKAAAFQLGPSSPLSNAGADLIHTLPVQMRGTGNMSDPQPPIDFDFKGGTYIGDVIGSIACTRAGVNATDLLPTSPMFAPYTTFGANALRITAGKGLLIEEARTQYISNPTAPANHTTGIIPNGLALWFWVNGPGTATIVPNSGTFTFDAQLGEVATHGKPIGISMTSAGTVDIVITGTLYAFQLEDNPNGASLPTSLITTTAARAADQVTSAFATAFGGSVESFLNGAQPLTLGGRNQVVAYIDIPCGTPFFNSALVFADNANLSRFGLVGAGTANVPSHVFLTIGAQTATTTGIEYVSPNRRQAIFGLVDQVTGLTVECNGGAFTNNPNPSSPAVTSPVWIGNRPALDMALNGYIERLLVWQGGNPLQTQQAIQTGFTSLTGVAPNATRDFFGNPVPGPGIPGLSNIAGQWSIGAHQPATPTTGGTVTLNGAIAVSVTNPRVGFNSQISFTLKAVGGAVGETPSIKTISPGVGFTVAGTAGDTSTYNYMILG